MFSKFHVSFSTFLVLSHVPFLLGCWGGKNLEEIQKGMLDPNNKNNWGGWNAPPGAQEAWKKWLNHYKDHTDGKGGVHDPAKHGPTPYGHGVKGWPDDWMGLGPPLTGMAPPPWAYVPKNTGKPSYCFAIPEAGNCTGKFQRFGYNGFMDECQPFVFTGCNGNRNNFETKLRCEQACMVPPESGCDNDSKIPIDNRIWSRRCGYYDDKPNDYVDVRNY